ncbi:MAG TPA: hypothetical protein DHV48_15275 [Prolixibacteraceae bacterium]|nr:hypothetical protein [Prolixibacteraceae bacterium]
MRFGQEKKNSIAINVSMAHYVNIDDFKNQRYDSYESGYKYPFSPGLELMVQRKFLNYLELGSGISFQTSKFQSHVNISYGYIHRFQCTEISIPLEARIYFPQKNNNRFFLSLGAYNGVQVGVTSRIPQSVGWTEWKELEKIARYSTDQFFTDTYSDIGYYWKLNEKEGISLLSFVTYRINATWLNTYQERIHWGIKFSYQFKTLLTD